VRTGTKMTSAVYRRIGSMPISISRCSQ
jgi:hypothetical protein